MVTPQQVDAAHRILYPHVRHRFEGFRLFAEQFVMELAGRIQRQRLSYDPHRICSIAALEKHVREIRA
jgi:hypothetical protein